MFIDPKEFKDFQIKHYQERLRQVNSKECKKFLQQNLDSLNGKVTIIKIGFSNK